jgi:hypothetical protein
VTVPVGDGLGTPDQGAAFLLMAGAFAFGWVGVRRVRGKGFPGLSRTWGWAAAGLSAACLVLAVVVPPILRPEPASNRPSSTARIRILVPAERAVFHGDPAPVEVRLALTGGSIVRTTSTRLAPDRGHVHLYLDGALVSMSYGLQARLEVVPGIHRLTAEFVALDHAPFAPRVMASADFTVVPPS